jgi:hypothetical protein
MLNTGTDPLIFTSIAVAGDFSIHSSTCGSELPYYHSSCRFYVYFTPTAPGLRTGTLTFIDNAPDSPQVVSLAGTGIGQSDFSLSANPSAITISAGQEAQAIINLTPIAGFTGTLTLSCAGTPPRGACSLDPASVSLDGSNLVGVQVNVRTTARSAAPWSRLIRPQGKPQPVSHLFVALALMLLLAGSFVARARGQRRLTLLLALTSVLIWATCGGGGGGSTGTPAGTYSLTVTATSGALRRSVLFSVTVR